MRIRIENLPVRGDPGQRRNDGAVRAALADVRIRRRLQPRYPARRHRCPRCWRKNTSTASWPPTATSWPPNCSTTARASASCAIAAPGGGTGYYHPDGRSTRRMFLRCPLPFVRVTSRYGMRRHPVLGYSARHNGTDFGAPYGTPVRATASGVVTGRGRDNGRGNYVIIRHANGFASHYYHLQRFAAGLRAGHARRAGAGDRHRGQHRPVDRAAPALRLGPERPLPQFRCACSRPAWRRCPRKNWPNSKHIVPGSSPRSPRRQPGRRCPRIAVKAGSLRSLPARSFRDPR